METKHFAVGTRIGFRDENGHRSGEIVGRYSILSSPSETVLYMAWDDGSMSLIKPLALNNHARSTS